MVELERVISMHYFVYFTSTGDSSIMTDSVFCKDEGTDNAAYLWDVKKNKVFRCVDGRRILVKEFKWRSPK